MLLAHIFVSRGAHYKEHNVVVINPSRETKDQQALRLIPGIREVWSFVEHSGEIL